MKNGMNVAAISELVHEIRKVPFENEIDYGVAVDWTGGLNMRARTMPLRFGTKRLGRDFAFDIGHLSDPAHDGAPTPADLFMLGLGSCVANIMVQGASYKGITLEALRLQAKAEQSPAALGNMYLGLSVKSDGTTWQYRQLMMNVARFSPNYITVTMPNSIDLSCERSAEAPALSSLHQTALSQPMPYTMPDGAVSLGMDIDWRNATQFDAVTRPRHWQGQHFPLNAHMCIDQPAPAAGLNEAPNPQEYLLSAITADVLQHLLLLLVENGHEVSKLSARMKCRLDMKGCFNIFDKSAVQLQQNRVHVSISTTASNEEVGTLLQKASWKAACFQAFVAKNKVGLDRFEDASQPVKQGV